LAAPPDRLLSKRQLNRALLARQLLLAREPLTPVAAIERLAGLQAQLARPPFIGLWSRLARFTREDLLKVLHARTVIRVTAMRGTLHLISARDYLGWRGPLQPALDRGITSIAGAALAEIDLAAAERATRELLERAPATFDAIRNHLAPAFSHANVRQVAYAIRMTLPLVQVPERETEWGFPGAADFALADAWLRKKVSATASSPKDLMRRYLAAFGPASVSDAQAWSGLTKLAPVFEELRPTLVTFQDERKRELFDLPEAPRPDADTPAPVRFLPEFDNLILGHQDRTRVISEEHRQRITSPNLLVPATLLVDGMVAGVWAIERKKREATLVIEPFVTIPVKRKSELREEAERLLVFSEQEVTSHAVKFKA
jgi:hypothetical protein